MRVSEEINYLFDLSIYTYMNIYIYVCVYIYILFGPLVLKPRGGVRVSDLEVRVYIVQHVP